MKFRAWLEVFDKLQTGQQFVWVDSDTGEAIPGPGCSQHSSALFQTGSHEYKVNFDIVRDGVISVDFLTRKSGVFFTREGIPFVVLNKVMSALAQYVAHCPIRAFTFTPQSSQRGRVFTKIINKILPDFEEYGSMFIRREI